MASGHVRCSPAVGQVLVQIPLCFPVEGYLLRVEFVGRELDFNKEEAVLSVYNEEVWWLWL